VVKPVTKEYQFKTTRAVPKLGVMLVGLGGNNGSTLTAGLIANREGLKWRTPGGEQSANYFGSLLQVRSRCEQSRLTSHGKTASKTQVMILCLGVPMNDSSAPWSSTPSLQRSIGLVHHIGPPPPPPAWRGRVCLLQEADRHPGKREILAV